MEKAVRCRWPAWIWSEWNRTYVSWNPRKWFSPKIVLDFLFNSTNLFKCIRDRTLRSIKSPALPCMTWTKHFDIYWHSKFRKIRYVTLFFLEEKRNATAGPSMFSSFTTHGFVEKAYVANGENIPTRSMSATCKRNVFSCHSLFS